jgi:hypothetical protein
MRATVFERKQVNKGRGSSAKTASPNTPIENSFRTEVNKDNEVLIYNSIARLLAIGYWLFAKRRLFAKRHE